MKITNTEVSGFEASIRGARNPMNSWKLSDSHYASNIPENLKGKTNFIIGKKDLELAHTLIKQGSEHCKFLRQIHVWTDIDFPRYWWSEFDTYSYNTKNSCSTMHKLLNKQSPITIDMFETCTEDLDIVAVVISRLNEIRELFLNSTSQEEKNHCLLRAKRLLMEGYMQLRTVDTNYQELRNIWLQRVKSPHRLKEEWVITFGNFIDSLPYADELIKYVG